MYPIFFSIWIYLCLCIAKGTFLIVSGLTKLVDTSYTNTLTATWIIICIHILFCQLHMCIREVINWHRWHSCGWEQKTNYQFSRHWKSANRTVLLSRWVLEESLMMPSFFACFFVIWPMIPLARRIAIFDEHTWLACLETDAFPLLIRAAIGAAHWLHSKCCLSRECGIPPCGAEARSEYVAAGGREQPSHGEREGSQKRRGQSSILAGTLPELIGDSLLRRTTTQQQGVNALYQCLLIKSSLSRYCTNHGREPVEQ